MADEIPQIPQVEEIFVHTGNTVNWNRLRRRLTQTPAEEVRNETQIKPYQGKIRALPGQTFVYLQNLRTPVDRPLGSDIRDNIFF